MGSSCQHQHPVLGWGSLGANFGSAPNSTLGSGQSSSKSDLVLALRNFQPNEGSQAHSEALRPPGLQRKSQEGCCMALCCLGRHEHSEEGDATWKESQGEEAQEVQGGRRGRHTEGNWQVLSLSREKL